MKIRLKEAVSGRLDLEEGTDNSLTQIDPGEYVVMTHHSGHLKVGLPNNQYALMAFDDFANGMKSGFIFVNA